MLVLERKVLEKIIKHCKKEFPLEACGIFVGRNDKAEKIFALPNIEKDSTRFLADAKEQLKAFKETEKLKMKILGIYHSHPDGSAYPSSRDRELAFYPDFFYLIVSLKNFNNPEIRVYRINGDKIEEEKMKIQGGQNAFRR
ncbi:MAG: M67 family metallopeptidase [Candidatus Omnitrophica bacterium]|nr:M67 family metallopeptidase [Candidatus Omnitrophota bacterium]